MNWGRIAVIATGATALCVGVSLWYLQVRYFYETLDPAEVANLQVTLAETGELTVLKLENAQGIDSTSSPIRYRACGMLADGTSLDGVASAEDAVPLVAPGWFSCFDAKAIGAALEAGEARAFLGVKDIRYGVDRVWAVFPDGRAYGWQQINACGEVVFDGDPLPEGCPAPPEE